MAVSSHAHTDGPWIDSVLADSFPASDPPCWTPAITSPTPRTEPDIAEPPVDVLVIESQPSRTFVQTAVSVAGLIGVVLAVPLLLIGLPIALLWRAMLAVSGWPAVRSSTRHHVSAFA